MDPKDIFEVLVRENGGMLTAFLRASVASASVADDLWQETMLTAWRRWDDYDKSKPFGAWLRGIAAKNLLAWNRKNTRGHVLCDAKTLEYYDQEFHRIHQLPGDIFDEKLAALRDCVDSLPAHYQEIVRLRFEQGLMPTAIADRLTGKTEAVKKRIQRAKVMLFECITRKLHHANGHV